MPDLSTNTNKQTAPDPDLKRRVSEEMDKLFCSQVTTSGKTGVLTVVLFTSILLSQYRKPEVVLWTVLIMSLYVARHFWLKRQMQRYANPCSKRSVLYMLDLTLCLTGILYGYATYRFMSPLAPITMMPTLLIMVAVLMASPPLLSARPKASIFFIIPLVAGIIVRLHFEAGDYFLETSVLLALIAIFAFYLGFRYYRNTRRGVRLALEKDDLLAKSLEEKARAEESAAAKGTFLATMSHEIRTPVNGLMGMLEILKETDLDATQANYLNTASRSAESLLQLLNDILDYSKIEVGKLELEKVPFDWIAMIGEIAMMNRVLASNKGVAFHLEIPAEGTSIVIGDPTRLRQILNNLLSNALKFTSEGSVSLKASITAEDATTVTIAISVRDTGIGISPEDQGKLFQKFQQATTSTTRRFGGTGLGLAISQHLAKLMGGDITLRSEPGKGSEFILAVPFPKSTAQSLEAFAANSSNLANDHFIARTLVVEDDPVSQRVAVLMLKGFGITPTVVNNAEAAIALSGREKFDLIFMDSHLPDMDGFDAAKAITSRKPVEGEEVKVPTIVAMSGADTPEDRAKAKGCGIRYFLPKPVRKREMRLCLEHFADKRRATNIPPAGNNPAK
jgi:signal transduction histidine kinase/CheY-like chemotaxis protein